MPRINAGIDQNSRQTLTALSSVDGETIVPLYADPTTHALLVDNPGGVSFPYSETPTGTIDGSNPTFTTSSTINAVYGLYMNGQYIHPVDYSIIGTTITFITPPDVSYAGLPFTIIYV